MHATDLEALACPRCALDSTDPAEDTVPVAFTDDRPPTTTMVATAIKTWEHQRWVRPGGILHRDKGPAVESEALNAWFEDGLLHREGAPAIVRDATHFAWARHGKPHRDDGPAIVWGDEYEWWKDGLCHRVDGPAGGGQGWTKYSLDGETVTRFEAWSRWVAAHSEIEPTNSSAAAFLAEVLGETDGTFPTVDPLLVAVALAMNPDPLGGYSSHASTASSGMRDEFPPEVAALAAPDHPLWPGRHLPPAEQRRALRYNVGVFERRIREAEHLGHFAPRPGTFVDRWESDVTYSRTIPACQQADLNLDAQTLAWGSDIAMGSRTTRRSQGGAREKSPVERRAQYVEAVDDHAGAIAHAHTTSGGFPSLPDLLGPSDRISDPIERAFEFAAQAIASGVCDILARAWATGIVVAAGYPKVPLWWGGDVTIDGRDYGLWPRRTLASDYYAQALHDLRERADATRFMDLVGRCYRWPSQ